jgi:pilus assembly protein Flp/PilA
VLTFAQAFDPTLGRLNPAESPPMLIRFAALIKNEAGVTAIEYGLIAALIVVGSIVAVNSVGLSLNLSQTFATVAANL